MPAYNVNPAPQTGVNDWASLIPGPLGAVDPVLAAYFAAPAPHTATATNVGNPMTVGLPDPYADLIKRAPWLADANTRIGSILQRKLAGEFTDQERANLQNEFARYGAAAGQPGSNAVSGRLFNNAALLGNVRATNALQKEGVDLYNNIIPTISATQTLNPALQASIGEFNAGQSNAFNLANVEAANRFNLFNTGAANAVDLTNTAAQNQNAQFNANVGNETNRTNVDIANLNAINAAAANPKLQQTHAEDLFNQYLKMLEQSGQNTSGWSITPSPTTGGFRGGSFGGSTWLPQGGTSELASYGNPYSIYNIGSTRPTYEPIVGGGPVNNLPYYYGNSGGGSGVVVGGGGGDFYDSNPASAFNYDFGGYL